MYDRLINNKITWYILLFLTVMIVSIPLFSNDLIFGHDTIFHLQRIEGIKEVLSNGDFPVKIYGYVYNNYGYPVGYFYPDLFLYIPALLCLIGFDIVFSYHFFLFLITLSTAIIAYISFNMLFYYISDKIAFPHYVYGAVATILYTGALYRLIDLYPRAAVGEALAMAFFPLALIGFYLTLEGEKNAWISVAVGASGILEAHILSSLLLFIAYVLMSIIFFKKFFSAQVLSSVLKASAFTLLLNLWFYAPFFSMYESFDFNMKSALKSVGDMFVFSYAEFLHYHFLVGILPIAIVCFYLVYISAKKLKNSSFTHLDKIFLLFFLLCIIFISLASPVIPLKLAESIPLIGEKLGVLQFPYRLTVFSTVFMSIALSIAICSHKRFLIIAFFIPFATIFWMLNLPLSMENDMTAIGRESNTKMSDKLFGLKETQAADVTVSSLSLAHNPDIWQYNDYLYKDIAEDEYKSITNQETLAYWEAVQNKTLLKLDPYDITPKEFISNFSRKGLHLNFTTNAKETTEIKLPLWYYPHSYGATCDGKELPVFEVNHHRLAVTAPAGEHNIKVFPKLHTPYRNACIISLLSLLAFIVVCVRVLRRENNSVVFDGGKI